jgi:stage II sporulation SpoE-like protein
VFFVLFGVPFFIDLGASGGYPLWAVFLLAAVLGGLHIIVILAELRSRRYVILPMLLIVTACLLFARVPQQQRTQEFTRHRMALDATCLFVTMLISYRLFLSFTTGEGMAHVALQTELSFAHAIQKTLVPPLSYRGLGLEALGHTVPSTKIGGDLVDLVADGENVFAYLADVSGHGISAGILMGMVKTAIRQALGTAVSAGPARER